MDISSSLDSHLENFQREGYTVFEKVYAAAQMEAWKRKFDERVLGPFVQLDNLTLAGFASTAESEADKAAKKS